MREVEIPGGKAFFREPGTDEIPGRSVKLIKAAATAAGTQLAEYPEIFEEPQMIEDPENPGKKRQETMEELNRRLMPKMAGLRLTMTQALAFDELREACVVGTLDNWTLDRALPKTIDQLGNLPSDLYEALLDAVGGVSATQLEANFNATGDPDDPVPTGNSGSSDGSSRTDPESIPTATYGSATSPTSGDGSSPGQ